MKNFTLSVLAIFGAICSNSQYNFTKTTGTYANLVGSTSVNNGVTWDDPQFTIPLGFNFTYFNSVTNMMVIEDAGLGAYLAINASETGVIPTLIPFGADIIDRGDFGTVSLSPISYLISGTAGNRIAKIEWRNVGFYSDLDDDGISTDFTNFQLWLYEGSNNIEIRFGPTSVNQPSLCYDGETGASVELLPNFDYTNFSYGNNGITLKGSPTAPIVKIINTINDLEYLTGTIPDGTIYRFVKNGATSIDENSLVKASLFPNPATSTITISTELDNVTSVVITDVNGRVINEINSNFKTIDISGLESGVYFATVKTNQGSAIKRFVKN